MAGENPRRRTPRRPAGTGPPRLSLVYGHKIETVLKLKTDLKEILAFELGGKTIRGPLFDRLVDLCRENLPPKGRLDRDNLEESLRHLAGEVLTPEHLTEVCWRMAGNLPRLKEKRPVPPWHGQRLPEWVPMQVMSCRPLRQGRSMGSNFGMKMLAGTPAGRTVVKWWSVRQCRGLYADYFGFSKPWRDRYHFSVPEQFVGLRLYGHVEPELCGDGPMFEKVAFPPAIAEYNREVLRKRFRVDEGYRCPLGLSSSFPCHHCPKGYKSCAAATHRSDWARGPCPRCKHDDALFDPDVETNLCVDCYSRQAFRGDQ